jgi:tape measure domain-containing protein
MTISLGQVEFGLGADTARLSQSISELQAFGRAVDDAYRSASSGVNQVAEALRRQERASVDAFTKTQSLITTMRGIKGTEAFVDRINSAYIQLNQTLTSGRLNSLEFQRAMERFKVTSSAAQKEFRAFTQTSKTALGANRYLVEAMNDLASAALLVAGPLSGIATRIVSLAAVMKRGGGLAAGFVAGFAGASYVLYQFGQAVYEAGVKYQKFEATLTAVHGNKITALVELDRAERIARSTGRSLEDVVPSFAKFQAAAANTSLTTKQIETIFTTVAAAATKLQLSSEETTGAFKALEQMISKGNVQAEELRGQLGDRLPGAFQIAARAMGVTTSKLNELLKKGQVSATTFLPKFAAELAKSLNIDSKPIDNFAASVANFNSAWTKLFGNLDRQLNVSSTVKKALDETTKVLDYFSARTVYTAQVVDTLYAALTSLWSPLQSAATYFDMLDKALASYSGSTVTYGDQIKYVMSDIADSMSGTIGKVADYWQQQMQSLLGMITDWHSKVVGYIVDSSGIAISEQTNLWSEATSLIVSAANTMINVAVKSVQSVATTLSNLPSVVASIAVGVINALLSAIENGLNKISTKVNEWISSIADSGFVQLLADKLGADLSKVKLPEVKLGKIEVDAPDYQGIGNQLMDIWNNDVDYIGKGTKLVGDALDNYVKTMHDKLMGDKQQQMLSDFKKSEIDFYNDLGSGPINKTKFGVIGADTGGGGSGGGKGKKSKANKASTVLDDLNQQLLQLYSEIDALQSGEPLDKLKEKFKIDNEIAKFAERLREAGVSAEVAAPKLDELRKALEMKDQLEKAAEGLQEFQNAIADGFSTVADSIIDALWDGEDAMKALADTAKNVVKEILKTFMQLAIINPLLNTLFGTSNPTLSMGGIIGSIVGAITGVKKAAYGTILTGPQLIGSSNGPVIGGEAGTEAILPLKRDAAGRLGVKAQGIGGGGGSTVVNVHNYSSEQADQRKSKGPNGEEMVDIFIGKVSRKIASGKMDSVFGNRFAMSSVPLKR